MINDKMNYKGQLHIVLKDETGKVKYETTVPNLVVTAGKNWIASRMASASSSVMTHMAVGTSGTAAAAGDTTLGAELSRVALSVSGGTPSSNSVTYAASYGAGVGTGSLQEAGIFNDPTTGTMLARTTFTTITKGASDTLSISWTITNT